MSSPYLEIHDSGKIRQMPLGDDPMTIGRNGRNRLIVSDTLASRFHCLISKSRHGYILRDLNSSNGTLLNGRLTRLARLRSGDAVQIGQIKLLFVAPNGEALSDDASLEGFRDDLDQASKILPLEFGAVLDSIPLEAEAPPTPAAAAHKAARSGPQGMPKTMPPPPKKPAPMQPAPMQSAPMGEPLELSEADLLPVSESDELAEPLSEMDVIWEDEAAAEPAADFPSSNDGLAADDGGILPDLAVVTDPSDVVETLVQSLPDRSFNDTDIALISARGQQVHPAGRAAAQGGRDAVGWLRLLLLLCARSHATDLHLEPKGNEYVVRSRIDGTMVEVCRVSNALGVRLSALVKVLSEIDISQRNTIQEGHFSSRVPSGRRGEQRRIDYRVSFAPSVFGQKLVVRVLDASYAPLDVGSLQLPDWMRGEIEGVIRQDAGMVLVCGPTGSGKTTTLYALIRGSDIEQRNVVTIEDPVEIQIAGVTQIPVDESQDKTFSSLLRSTLRQDPDVILIGEIRDAETARIAMQAAITGHLVFSTVHTQNTIGTIFRLLDLGVEPYLISQALHVVVAQRLVRQLCPYCKMPVKPTPEQLTKIGKAGEGVDRFFAPRGCARCLHTGFIGRRAIFELLSVGSELRDLITQKATASQFQAALAGTAFRRLHESGYELVAKGISAFDEIDRAVGRDAR